VSNAVIDSELRREQLHLDGLYARLDEVRAETARELARVRRSGTTGTPASRVERDAFSALHAEHLERLNAVEERLCIGRLDMSDGVHRYIGRLGLTDANGTRLLIDWRAPAAQPFYRATPAEPDGVISRRHLNTTGRTVTGIQDEVIDLDAFALSNAGTDTLGADGALMLALNANRTGRMRDIVATIQAEQDRIIRAPLAGVLVVQGGPGTGKTVVALHRAAYLLYAHRERLARTGVLVVGPNNRFLRYIERVLPSLGETGVVMATAGQLYPGIDATASEDPMVTAIKGDLSMARVLANAVRARQRVPRGTRQISVEGTTIELRVRDVDLARHRAQLSRKPHNIGRVRFVQLMLERLAGLLAAALGTDLDEDTRTELLDALRASPDVRREINLCWMPLTPQKLLRDLFADPTALTAAAPQLSPSDRQLLRRDRDAPWTPSDVALLDEAAELLGEQTDDDTGSAAAAAERADEVAFASTVLELSPEAAEMTTADVLADRYGAVAGRRSLSDHAAGERGWAFGHVVIDEAQELSAMQWRMLMRRCPSKSMTVVGDTAQTGSPAGAKSWGQMLDRYVRDRWRLQELTVNYRTPGRIMQVATATLAAAGIRATALTSAREGDWPPSAEQVSTSLAEHAVRAAQAELALLGAGRLAIITPRSEYAAVAAAVSREFGTPENGDDAVSVLTASQSKGLEFDGVVLVEPIDIVTEAVRGPSDLYVAMTRSTQRLRIVHRQPLPASLSQLEGPG
jgi:DNA helicase IV